ncbi:hypothetical protein GCM10007989_33720 [Devosia pacifica]|uniref:Uncharacterized protein n=1 Tax=Devosia pacifica TaxID=1335967 RepID=A0A918VY96_9HYPH|nr:hypothetical protein [Devosia pacifica]GHA35053.1 hypothetical protein GCM10007989_33720 [Devosia pacifica]
MTITTSLDHQMSYRERQEFEVMITLEEAIKTAQPIDTSTLATRIVDAIENIDPAEFEEN